MNEHHKVFATTFIRNSIILILDLEISIYLIQGVRNGTLDVCYNLSYVDVDDALNPI